MNISTGMGFRLRPELVLLSPLSLAPSLILELLLSRLCNPPSRSKDNFLDVGLRGPFKAEERFAEVVVALTGATLFLFFFEGERLKRGIQEEDDDCAAWRSARDPRVEDDQRERSVRSGAV